MGKSGENTGRPPLPNKEVVRLGKAIYEKDLSPDPPKAVGDGAEPGRFGGWDANVGADFW